MRSKKQQQALQLLMCIAAVGIVLLLCLLAVRIAKHFNDADSSALESGDAAFLQASDVEKTASGEDAVQAEINVEEPVEKEPVEKESGEKEPVEKESGVTQATTVVFAGDIYMSEYIQAAYDQSGVSGVLSPDMLRELKGADLTIINNEFPYSTRGMQAPDKQFTFRVNPSYVSLLQDVGVDIAVLANNHVLDYGKDALTDTFTTLDQAGIEYAGAGESLERASKLVKKNINGLEFGLLAVSRVYPDVSWNVEISQPGEFSAYDPTALIQVVEDAKEECDFLCVYLHWGLEKHTTPEEYQVSMAHQLIDAGADAVIGAHPHVLQGVEWYKDCPIFYSLGNYIFYQTIERTAIAKLTVTPPKQVKWQLLPGTASGCLTYLITDQAKCDEFYEDMKQLSFDVDYAADGGIVPIR